MSPVLKPALRVAQGISGLRKRLRRVIKTGGLLRSVFISGLICLSLPGTLPAEEYADTLYTQGASVFERDPSKALELFQLAGDEGSVPAMVGAGHCYETGTGTKRDYAKALEWYEKAAREHSLKACEGLARIYACCPDPEFHDGDKAVRFATFVARKKPMDCDTQDLLAMACLRGMRTEEAVRAGMKAVKYANAHEQANDLKKKMSTYKEGRPVPAKATAEWLMLGAEKEIPWAVITLARKAGDPSGEMYNPELAISVCERGLEQGLHELYFEMGMVHFHEKNFKMAKACFQSAANHRSAFRFLPVEVKYRHYLTSSADAVFAMAGKFEKGYTETVMREVNVTRREDDGQGGWETYTYKVKQPHTQRVPANPTAALCLYKIAAKKGHQEAAAIVADKEGPLKPRRPSPKRSPGAKKSVGGLPVPVY